MSQQLINHNSDLKKLRDQGYEVEVRANYLLVHSVPYLNSKKEIKMGTLISELTLAGNKTTKPNTHVIHFMGEHPCNKDGSEIVQIKHQSTDNTLAAGIVSNHSFSNKPKSGYNDYFEKIKRYADIISAPAQSLDSRVTAKTFRVTESTDDETVFNYIDTNSSRADIYHISEKLKNHRIGIIGLGGTGSYILDSLAKTPVAKIHIYDGDRFLQHNAFRSPGAPTIDELRKMPKKVDYFYNKYSSMHKHIVPHDYYINTSNIDQLLDLDFVFLCIDKGGVKEDIITKMEVSGIAFIDVGMGIEVVEESLIGMVRVTTSTEKKREHIRTKNRISFAEDVENVYSNNIQIADLNMLNASLAVIKWKKICGFYQDLEKENHTIYSLNDHSLIGDDYDK